MGNRSEGEQKNGAAARRLLITGAGGFCGSHAVRHFAAAGYEVHAVVRPGSLPERASEVLSSAMEESSDLPLAGGKPRTADISVHHCHMGDRTRMLELVSRISPDAVLHLAGANATGPSGGIRRRSWRRTSWEPSICWRPSEQRDAPAAYSLPARCWAAVCPRTFPRSRPILTA